jgi:hypothetical protein
VIPFLNGFAKEQDVINAKNQLVGVLELFLFMASSKLQFFLGVWQNHTKQLLVAKLANVIWSENWDA